ncbi:DUF2125 domain-containing protein [Yoonia litorea]|uniref:DUF2125 domain-containing protein n=1 Tax=Yoonia litorea TaxID=1123755 RepID=A0A1I6MWR6_9RHOB|nr:DUF2125 domain-containing protein [Yoonia litorea]SFS20153.1 hypothetical protein SAMN05444714_2499 [Yoonia litorea]
MAHSKTLKSAVCIAALFAGNAAAADVTAAEVWQNLKSQFEVYGEDGLSIGAEETSSGTVTVRDIAVTFADEEVSVTAEVGDMFFNEQADGTVRVTMEETYPMVITGDDGVVITLDVVQNNFVLVVSGTTDAMNYAVSADTYGIAFRDAIDGGVTYTGDASFMANTVTGSYVVNDGELREVISDISVATVDILVDFQLPGGEGEYVTGAAKINGLSSQGEATVPSETDFENPDMIFMDGFGFNAGYTIESADYVFDINAEGDQAAGSVSTGPVSLSAEMDAQTVAYASNTRDIAVSMQTSDFPLPIALSVDEYGVGFQMPIGVTDEPAPFGLQFDLVDLEISEMLWNIFDPNAVLPRDPATLQIALNGTARALIDFLDPANADAMESTEIPFEPYSISLDNLRISAAGALITGSGAFDFDNSDLETFAPMPRPEGSATIEIEGLNGLLDNLVTMGLVPQDQIMGPRMMMGMFARSTGDDQMEIEVEVAPNGQVNVNGNRVR